jgi:hypothetical protein
MPRATAETLAWPPYRDVVEIADGLPAEARLGYVLDADDWIYVLYGPRLERPLVKLPREGAFAQAEQQDVDLVVANEALVTRPPGTWVQEPVAHLIFFARSGTPAATQLRSAVARAR